jgi:cytochrome c-type biogenesis protein CcmH/NrfG
MRCSPYRVRVSRHPRRLLSLALVAAIALALTAACTQSPEARKQQAIQRAEQYLKEGKVNEAVIELRNALQIDGDFVPALVGLGRAYAAKGWHADASRELLRAQKLQPNDAGIALLAARELLEVGALRDADEQAGKVLALQPNNREALLVRAAALLSQGRLEEAQQALQGPPRPAARRHRAPAHARRHSAAGASPGEPARLSRRARRGSEGPALDAGLRASSRPGDAGSAAALRRARGLCPATRGVGSGCRRACAPETCRARSATSRR